MMDWFQNCGRSLGGSERDKKRALANLERAGGWVAEPKKDGIWCAVVIRDGTVQFISRTGKDKAGLKDLRERFPCFGPDSVLIGELGVGSQAAAGEKRRIGHDYIDLFDVVWHEGQDLCHMALDARRAILTRIWGACSSEWVRLVPQFHTDFVRRYEAEPEGLVLKRTDAAYVPGTPSTDWVKAKKRHTADYVILDWQLSTAETKTAEPMAATILCGAYVRSRDGHGTMHLAPLVKVGGLARRLARDVARDFGAFRGRVAEIGHCGQFRSGSLRHPAFIRLRPDKRAEECILVQHA